MNQSDREFLDKLRESALEDLMFFSNSGRSERERWVVSEFLRLQKIQFSAIELCSQPVHSKVDIEFRGANFQVKEILNPGIKRHRDAKGRYEKLRSASSIENLILPGLCYATPPVVTIYDLISTEADSLASSGKYITVKSNLDLIFYVTRTRASLIKKDEINHEHLASLGWRSISCLAGKQAIVVFAASNAPAFLRDLSASS